ncbi:two component transcriptional regulator, LytTR family [Algoriphagus faecimaris]|uniref:Two component transcriptional regulator, LytTR family n=1 Tax=Algoriphagus faecimaris TaxID=686796 RepID=A0A1G6W1S6_9BACT|nr:LytTR family DNA-binding domain-containing protein [Algoriphagus faecimaris]SDD59781.1 two component transcriptional regulator, LytTR family [Algoriphagus faecimaris]
MKAILIDDQDHVRENLRMLIETFVPEVNVVAEAEGVRSGLECIREHQPDLVFLDIEMKDGTGFDLLSLMGDQSFKLIFVTGHDGFAIRAFKVSAIDYILKPVDAEDLVRAVEKAKVYPALQEIQVQHALNNSKSTSPETLQIVLSDSENIFLIDLKNILRCQAEGNYTKFFLEDGRVILVSKTLKEYNDLLEQNKFFRTHQSHLINLRFFDHYDRREGGMIYLKDGSQVPLATRRKDLLISVLKSI